MFGVLLSDIMFGMQIIDPKQALTLSYYRNPTSETFGDLQNSAVRAGYPMSYARNLTGKRPAWLTANTINDIRRVQRAEKNLDKYNDMEVNDLKTRTDVEKAKIQIDVSKFLLKTQARAKYSEDKEAEAPSVTINIMNYNKSDATPLTAKDVEVKDVEEQG